MHSTVRLKAVTLMEGDEPLGLIVQIVIECEECGECILTLAGHHVRPVIELLQEVLCREPELTDAGECVSVVSRESRIWPENN